MELIFFRECEKCDSAYFATPHEASPILACPVGVGFPLAPSL